MQEVMGPLPSIAGKPRTDLGPDIDEGDFVRRHLRFEAEPGDWVPAWLLIPKRRPKRCAAVVCLHQTTRIGKDEPAGLGGKPELHYARELALRGYVTLAPDYPNFGEYKTDVYSRGYASATMKGILNHSRAVDVLSALPCVDRRRLAACGHSLGGHNSLFLAAFDSRVRAVITSCGFTSFRKYYGGDLTGWSHAGYMPRIATVYGKNPARMPFDFPDVLSAILPRAVFVNAPRHDTNFEVSGVQDCIAAIGNPSSVTVVYPDCGHEFPAGVREQAWQFLQRAEA